MSNHIGPCAVDQFGRTFTAQQQEAGTLVFSVICHKLVCGIYPFQLTDNCLCVQGWRGSCLHLPVPSYLVWGKSTTKVHFGELLCYTETSKYGSGPVVVAHLVGICILWRHSSTAIVSGFSLLQDGKRARPIALDSNAPSPRTQMFPVTDVSGGRSVGH